MTAVDPRCPCRRRTDGRRPPRDVLGAYVGADQAAHHRAAAAHHRAGDVPGRSGVSRRLGWWSPPCSAARSRPAARTPSTASTTATSTQRMRRTRRRPLPRHIVSTAGRAGLRARARRRLHAVARPARSTGCPPALALAANVFYVVVYTMILKRRTAAEHRLGRRRRLLPGADRLDRGHRLAGLGAGRAVPGHVLLDAAALLGAGACATATTTPRAGVPMLPGRRRRQGRRPADRRATPG